MILQPAHDHSPSARQMAEVIADDIVAGRFKEGEKLPPERVLAARFRVGRPLVREALRTVEELGLVETQPGRGTFVRQGTSARMHRQLGMAIRRRGATAAQLSEARIALEGYVAGLAAVRATEADIERLEVTLRRLESSVSFEHVRFDLEFHLSIATSAHNPVLEMMLESIAPLTAGLMMRSTGDEEVMRRSQPHHRAVFEAIRRRDPEAAREGIEAHLSVARDVYDEDYERSVDVLAQRSLAEAGYAGTLDELVAAVFRARRDGADGSVSSENSTHDAAGATA